MSPSHPHDHRDPAAADILVNGEATAYLTPHDRALAYGDGLFETIAIHHGRAPLWRAHMQRLRHGCRALKIDFADTRLLAREAKALLAPAPRQIIKIIISRGAGGRGYRADATMTPTRIVMRYDWPPYPDEYGSDGVRIGLCQTRLGAQPALAGIKHLNRLEQVLARAEWGDELQEGLMRDRDGRIISGTMSNLFLARADGLVTPALDDCGVAGVQRRHIIHTATRLGIDVSAQAITLEDMQHCDEMFLTNSVIGVWPVREFISRALPVGALTRRLQRLVAAATTRPSA